MKLGEKNKEGNPFSFLSGLLLSGMHHASRASIESLASQCDKLADLVNEAIENDQQNPFYSDALHAGLLIESTSILLRNKQYETALKNLKKAQSYFETISLSSGFYSHFSSSFTLFLQQSTYLIRMLTRSINYP